MIEKFNRNHNIQVICNSLTIRIFSTKVYRHQIKNL